jgi:hypothetical protein
VFDFVNPVFSLRRLIDQGSKLWLNEPEPCIYAGHKAFCSGRMFFREVNRGRPWDSGSNQEGAREGGSRVHQRQAPRGETPQKRKPRKCAFRGLLLKLKLKLEKLTLGDAYAGDQLIGEDRPSIQEDTNGKRPGVRMR